MDMGVQILNLKSSDKCENRAWRRDSTYTKIRVKSESRDMLLRKPTNLFQRPQPQGLPNEQNELGKQRKLKK